MARIQTGSIVTDIRGKVAGSVFQKGASGLVLRSNPKNLNKRNALTSMRRVLMQTLQQSWGALSVSQRSAWSAWSAFSPIVQFNNPGKFLNGHQSYLQINYYRQLYGIAVISDPIFSKSTLPPYDVTVSKVLTTCLLTWSDTIDTDTTCILVALSGMLPNGVNNALRRTRQIIFTNDDDTGQNITSQVTTLFGTVPALGSRLFISYAIMDIGVGSIAAFTNKIITVG